MQSYYVYVIYSKTIDSFYIGQSVNLEVRVQQHVVHEKLHATTAKADDWVIFYYLECKSRQQAIQIEHHIKRMKSRNYLENLKKYPEIGLKLLAKYA